MQQGIIYWEVVDMGWQEPQGGPVPGDLSGKVFLTGHSITHREDDTNPRTWPRQTCESQRDLLDSLMRKPPQRAAEWLATNREQSSGPPPELAGEGAENTKGQVSPSTSPLGEPREYTMQY